MARTVAARCYRRLRGLAHDLNGRARLALGQDRVALASYPRSGNTWLRAMIERATGERSGSIYDDEVLPRGGEGVVIKTHRMDGRRYSRAIHLVRHPMDAIFSHFKWKKQVAGVDVAWEDHLEAGVERWLKHSRYWCGCSRPRCLVRFEDIKEDPRAELSRVVEWLGRTCSDDRVDEAVESTRLEKMRRRAPESIADSFYRTGETGDGRRRIDRKSRAHLEERLGRLLDRFGYGSS